jgi:hypothetical protein
MDSVLIKDLKEEQDEIGIIAKVRLEIFSN